MTDQAHELRRHARKIAHPAGDVPAVMLAAADEIKRLRAENAGLVDDMNLLRDNNTALLARIEAMEQPAPTTLVGARKVTRDFRWDSATQCHVPTLKVEFEPVHIDAPTDAKGWQDQDRIAATLEAAPGAQPAPSVPEGWKLVPTAESRHPGIYKMLSVLHTVDNTPGASEWESYAAFLAATPEVKP